MANTVYILDTNVFIEAHKRYYSLDLCHGFWECLRYYCQKPRLLSIDRVKNEITEGDELHRWIENSPDELFLSTATSTVVKEFSEMMAWVQSNPQFYEAAKAKFAQDADGWVIAYAKAHDCIVVTHEVFNQDSKRRVPIPNVCREFDVDYVDTFKMLRSLEVRFGWDK